MSNGAEGTTGHRALVDLLSLRDRLRPQVAGPVQFPEPALKLDLESRRGSDERTFKHLHQSALLHRENFCAANRIKLVSLLDAYLELAKSQNGLALYVMSRSIFELNAFLHEVRTRLLEAAGHAEEDWRQAGQMFFGLVVRARFATTNEDFKALLREGGLPEDRLKPLNVMNCIRGLAQEAGWEDAPRRYDILCDYVHHNLGSATTANAGSGEAAAAVYGGGAMLWSGGRGTVTQYEYPLPSKYASALEDTAPGCLDDARGCLRWISEIPHTPYPPQMVERYTGTPLGVTILSPPNVRPPRGAVGRNEPCPCGSGVKYKRCCGGTPSSTASSD